jgi:hypothetical protein
MQAYSDQDYLDLLHECGFGRVRFYPSLTGRADEAHEGLFALVARKAGGQSTP